MQRLTHRRILSLLLGFPIACSSGSDDGDASSQGRGNGTGNDNDFISADDGANAAPGLGGPETTLRAARFSFPGAGSSAAALPLVAGLGPETAGECNPEPAAGSSATIDDVQTFCFFDESDSGVPVFGIPYGWNP